jgi:hypothetical protein
MCTSSLLIIVSCARTHTQEIRTMDDSAGAFSDLEDDLEGGEGEQGGLAAQ